MKSHTIPSLALPLAALSVGVVALAMPVLALADDPRPIVVEELTPRGAITDEVGIRIGLAVEGRDRQDLEVPETGRVATARITIQPGAAFPWHSHPGPVLATVAQGELVYVYVDDCVERPYAAGELFIDPGFDNIHSAFNPSEDEVAVVVATFLNAPEGENGQGLTIPREPEQTCPDLPIGGAH
ncbi:cupin domain-containing protein [Halomonas heilongjiangensis]|uniref:Cupin domain-containing protein n=1 Tax=Halomonas heilongjiangensis TaxID=1387883 RepID=A0A2N7TKX9_9GAMM|nr:cupin domain-containing protein [Halomonas heilongjiangensis]PMR68842.1 cupin domain-containing protein [Halomonas heilongjiangensis]PXX94557.1 hypothetical protein CR158_01215 [Halomonas heilongjiangensis]